MVLLNFKIYSVVSQYIMSSTVKNFSVGYYPINQYNVFTSGDYIRGQVTLELAKDCKIFSLYVTLKGKAEVSWTDYYKNKHKTYNDKVTYFKKREFIIEEDNSKYTTYVIYFRLTCN